MIAYKVVNNKRESVFAKDKYQRTYKVGSTVKAYDKSLGIFCFDTFDKAQGFSIWACMHLPGYYILNVEGIGELKRPEFISANITADKIDDFYITEYLDAVSLSIPPSGTICFPSIKVLSEIGYEYVNE